MVKPSDQQEIQLDIQNKELVTEEIEAIIEEFEAAMVQANKYISQAKGDKQSIASKKSSKKN